MPVLLPIFVIQTIALLALIHYRHPRGASCACAKCHAHRVRNGWTS